MHRRRLALASGHKRMADFVVRNNLFLLGQYDGALALIAGDDHLNALIQVALRNRAAPHAHSAQGGFVYDVGKLCARGAGRRARKRVKVDVAVHIHVFRVNLEYLLAPFEIRQLDRYAAVKATGAQQRLIKRFRAVGGRQYDDAVLAIEPVHFCKELVERLLALVV
ncbi:hypothetical protein SDC9_153874 [bioreactor metagenome]|uniref:Uncharacterized protein n=1 Tax=bioreactor metagenome TaxID=1076179 RepID=A0A645EX56_9ZZZZ